jgi:hypothetical protein
MERIESQKYVRLKPVVVHRLDLDEVVRKVGSLGSPAKLTVGDFLVQSLDEAQREFGNTIRQLDVDGNGARVSFDERATSLFGRSPEGKAAVLEIAEQIRPRQRTDTPAWLSFLGATLLGAGIMGYIFSVDASQTKKAVNLAEVVVGYLALVASFLLPRPSKLILVRVHEAVPWYRKYQGDIIRGTVTGLIGVVFGYLLRMLQGH